MDFEDWTYLAASACISSGFAIVALSYGLISAGVMLLSWIILGKLLGRKGSSQ